MRPGITPVFFTFLLFLLSSVAHAATIHVGPGEVFGEIQPALDAAAPGDEVVVREGIYTGPGNRELNFRGKAITLRSEYGPDTCIIDCEFQGRGVFFRSGETAEAVLDGFTITYGYIVGDWYDGVGGGIRCEDSSPTITNCTISNNSATRGGGIYSYHASPTIKNCAVIGNLAEEYGGGIMQFEALPEISNCTIRGNSADVGGGVFFDYSAATISDCTVSGNVAIYGGGGIHCWISSPTITDCIISENLTIYDEGGGIYCYVGSPKITRCIINDNYANDYGGGILCSINSSPVISKCIIRNNRARLHGGGIFCVADSSPRVENCIISGNVSRTYGGGIACKSSSSPVIVNSTISGNSASVGGGGIYSEQSSSPEIINSILWKNCATAAEIYVAGASALKISYSDIQGGQQAAFVAEDGILTWGEGNLDEDPLFADDGYYHLTLGSPCIDTGTDAGICNDIDGDMRPIGSGTDMGADEFSSPPPPPPPFSKLNLLAPADLSVVISPPTFDWNADGGTNNGYAVDLSASPDFKNYWSTYKKEKQALEETIWTMTPEVWNKIPSGKKIYWRVRGADSDINPLKVIKSEQVWSFKRK